MRILYLQILLISLLFPSIAQGEIWYVIQLKNGTTIRSTFMHNSDDETVEFKLKNGNSIFYKISDIASIETINEEDITPRDFYKRKSIALAWSLIPPLISPVHGIGQFYNGDIGKGIFFLALGIAGSTLIYNGITSDGGYNRNKLNIGVGILVTSWIFSSYDAYESARQGKPMSALRIYLKADSPYWWISRY